MNAWLKKLRLACQAAWAVFLGDLRDLETDEPPPQSPYGLIRHDETDYILSPFRILVANEQDRQQLLALSKYIHDLREIDTDYQAVNAFAHLYLSPELIQIEGDPPCSKY